MTHESRPTYCYSLATQQPSSESAPAGPTSCQRRNAAKKQGLFVWGFFPSLSTSCSLSPGFTGSSVGGRAENKSNKSEQERCHPRGRGKEADLSERQLKSSTLLTFRLCRLLTFSLLIPPLSSPLRFIFTASHEGLQNSAGYRSSPPPKASPDPPTDPYFLVPVPDNSTVSALPLFCFLQRTGGGEVASLF